MPTEPFTGNETEGSPVAPETPGQGTAPATTEPGYITANQLKEALDGFGKSLDDKLSSLYRGIQSQNDKLDARVQKKIAAYEQAALAQGYTLTPNQKQQLTDQTTIEEIRASQNETPRGTPDQVKPQGATEDEFVRSVNIAAETLLKVAGVSIDESDPEAELINKAAEGTAEQYLDAHREAIRLKKERLASGGKETPQRAAVSGVPGAIPGSPNANPIANITDPTQLWQLANKR